MSSELLPIFGKCVLVYFMDVVKDLFLCVCDTFMHEPETLDLI